MATKALFIVNAWIVDANGTFTVLDGYPKTFNSKSYDGDVDKALKRANGEFSDVWSKMCKRDDRQIQTVTLHNVNGVQLAMKSDGQFKPDPEPEPEPTEE